MNPTGTSNKMGLQWGQQQYPLWLDWLLEKGEETVIHNRNNNPYHLKIKLYRWYIDDILLFWEGTQEELMDFVSYINNSSSFLKFTCEQSTDKINYLDLTIHKDEQELFILLFIEKRWNTIQYCILPATILNT